MVVLKRYELTTESSSLDEKLECRLDLHNSSKTEFYRSTSTRNLAVQKKNRVGKGTKLDIASSADPLPHQSLDVTRSSQFVYFTILAPLLYRFQCQAFSFFPSILRHFLPSPFQSHPSSQPFPSFSIPKAPTYFNKAFKSLLWSISSTIFRKFSSPCS